MFTATINIDGFRAMSYTTKMSVAGALKKAVDFGIDALHKEMVVNVMGIRHLPGTPGPYPGKLPVTRISTDLSKCISFKRINNIFGIVFADTRKAWYAGIVHDGNGRMAPRPFARAAVNNKREAILRRMRYEVQIALRWTE